MQQFVALSSGEAELNVHVLGIWEGFWGANLCQEWGMLGSTESLRDRFVARGIASRVGSGKLLGLGRTVAPPAWRDKEDVVVLLPGRLGADISRCSCSLGRKGLGAGANVNSHFGCIRLKGGFQMIVCGGTDRPTVRRHPKSSS